jgi:hypothetical protein
VHFLLQNSDLFHAQDYGGALVEALSAFDEEVAAAAAADMGGGGGGSESDRRQERVRRRRAGVSSKLGKIGAIKALLRLYQGSIN